MTTSLYFPHTRLTCGVLVDGDLPGVLPAPHHLRLRRARGHALQRHVAALGLHHVRAAQAVHDPGRHWAVEVSVYIMLYYCAEQNW